VTPATRGRGVNEAAVQPSFADRTQLVGDAAILQRELHAWMGDAKAPEQLRQIGIQQGAHEPELEPGEDAARGALRRGRRPFEAKQRFADLVIEGAARDGQGDGPVGALEETEPQATLQRSDVPAERRLRQA